MVIRGIERFDEVTDASHVWNRPNMMAAARYHQSWRELTLYDELRFNVGFSVAHRFNPHES